MTEINLSTAADYADSLLAAKRFKNILFVGLLLVLVIQISLFFFARYSTGMKEAGANPKWPPIVEHVLAISNHIGLIAPILLSVTVLLSLFVLLVGRLLGAGALTSAFLWSTVLLLMLFPWQSILSYDETNPVVNTYSQTLKIPGVLCTWTEFSNPKTGYAFDSAFDKTHWTFAFLRWARFVAFPILASAILIYVQRKSDRGLRQALGVYGTSTTPATRNLPEERL